MQTIPIVINESAGITCNPSAIRSGLSNIARYWHLRMRISASPRSTSDRVNDIAAEIVLSDQLFGVVESGGAASPSFISRPVVKDVEEP